MTRNEPHGNSDHQAAQPLHVAVTGAAGYLGLNVLDAFRRAGHTVVAVDTSPPSAAVRESARWVTASVLDERQLTAALEGADVLVHLAAGITLRATDPAIWRLNTEGVAVAAAAARNAQVRRMVHCSSVHAFDTTLPRVDESSARAGAAAPLYDRSKLEGERRLRDALMHGLDAVIVNPTGIFGPIDNPQSLSRMNGILRNAALGRVPIDMRGGFDWVDARDVAQGILNAALTGRTGENYLLGGGFLTMHEAIRMATNAVGRRPPAITLPLELLDALLPIAEPVSRWLHSDVFSAAALTSLKNAPTVDSSKAASELGFRTRQHSETIRDLMGFFVAAGALDRKAARRQVAVE